MPITTVCRFFDALSPAELYAIMRLRIEVFVVEQNCVFQDADNKDPQCYHLMLWEGNTLAAYTRLVPPGLSYPEMSIGRVVSNPQHRGTGIGRVLLQQSIEHCFRLFGEGVITIGAQLYLRKFYESFGFRQVGDVYDEDGIDHIKMKREV